MSTCGSCTVTQQPSYCSGVAVAARNVQSRVAGVIRIVQVEVDVEAKNYVYDAGRVVVVTAMATRQQQASTLLHKADMTATRNDDGVG